MGLMFLSYNRRGLSPIIATTLMILLVMVLATMIFLWARGFLGEQIEKFGTPIEQQCGNIKLEVALVDGVTTDNALEVTNYGDVDVFSLEIRKTYGGNTESDDFPFYIDKGASSTKDVSLTMTEGDYRGQPEKVVVYPSLLGSVKGRDNVNRPVVCEEQGFILNLN